jgi:thiol peroxidase
MVCGVRLSQRDANAVDGRREPIRTMAGDAHPTTNRKDQVMSRSGVVTFKGAPLTLAGEELRVGHAAPDFKLHYFEGGMKSITLADVKGKPTLVSVVPSLDTAVCAMQTKKFNEAVGTLGDRINALTVSMDLPFAQNRFCGSEGITNIRTASDYQDRSFGQNWGTLIEEIKILCRAVFVLNADGKVVYAQYVPEVTNEPDYDAALEALRGEL